MNTKLRAIILVGLVLALIFVGYLIFRNISVDSQEPKHNTSTVHFLQSQGEVHASPEELIPLDLFFYASGDNATLSDQENKPIVQIDNSALWVVDYSVEAGDAYKGMRLYAIHLSLQADQPGHQRITRVIVQSGTGKAKTYEVGEVNINIEKGASKNLLKIFEHTGTATLGAPYLFTLKNASRQNCTVTGIELGSLSSFVNNLRVMLNEKQVDVGKGIIVKPGGALSVEADFKTNVSKDIYYVSPKVLYQTQGGGTKFSYSPPHATFGMPVTEDKVVEIYEKFFHN